MMMEITRRPSSTSSPIRQLFESFANDPFLRSFGMTENGVGALAVDIEEVGDNIIVTASLPGFRKEDVQIEVQDGVLSITAQHEEETEERERNFYRRERRTGSLTRQIALPSIVDDANAHAELKDGVLTVAIPKAEQAKPKRISVS